MKISCPEGKPTDPPLGQGFEVPLGSLWFDESSQQWHHWSERWLVLRSDALARRQIRLVQKLNLWEKREETIEKSCIN